MDTRTLRPALLGRLRVDLELKTLNKNKSHAT